MAGLTDGMQLEIGLCQLAPRIPVFCHYLSRADDCNRPDIFDPKGLCV